MLTTFEIPPIDLAFAESLLKHEKEATFEHTCFLAFLLASARSGALFLEVEEDKLNPTVEEIWGPQEEMTPAILKGAKTLPKMPFVIKNDSKYYLQRLFLAEQICFKEWNRLISAPSLSIHPSESLTELNEEQKQAVELGCRSSVFVLTGGPGTGKTFTAGRLLKTLTSNHPCKINVAAPTGKAALTLQTALSKTLDVPLQAKTLHALLGIKGAQKNDEETTILPYDILLIDECSMIDVELMAKLLSSIKTGARLILLGDPYQLPPVEGAPIFPTLVKAHHAKVELKTCLRAESHDLLEAAKSILETGTFSPSLSVKLIEDGKDLNDVIQSHLHHFPQNFDEGTDPAKILEAFQRFKVLTPLRRGKAGSVELNRQIFHALNKNDRLHAIPIMITANDYQFDLYNGEIGILMTKQKTLPFHFTEEDYVYFPSMKLPAALLPSYELAYAMTVHKSQGSEFGEVLLLLPESSHVVSKPLLYTAFTRARRGISVWKESS